MYYVTYPIDPFSIESKKANQIVVVFLFNTTINIYRHDDTPDSNTFRVFSIYILAYIV